MRDCLLASAISGQDLPPPPLQFVCLHWEVLEEVSQYVGVRVRIMRVPCIKAAFQYNKLGLVKKVSVGGAVVARPTVFCSSHARAVTYGRFGQACDDARCAIWHFAPGGEYGRIAHRSPVRSQVNQVHQ